MSAWGSLGLGLGLGLGLVSGLTGLVVWPGIDCAPPALLPSEKPCTYM